MTKLEETRYHLEMESAEWPINFDDPFNLEQDGLYDCMHQKHTDCSPGRGSRRCSLRRTLKRNRSY